MSITRSPQPSFWPSPWPPSQKRLGLAPDGERVGNGVDLALLGAPVESGLALVLHVELVENAVDLGKDAPAGDRQHRLVPGRVELVGHEDDDVQGYRREARHLVLFSSVPLCI